MMQQLITNVICPFIGTTAFAVLYNVPKRFYLSCGITGTLGWLMFVMTKDFSSVEVASFLGALVVVLISRILTVYMKCPITIFLVSGIFPLVPGAGIYYTVYYLVTDQLSQAALKGIESVKIAFAIVLGIAFIVSIPREFFQPQYWKQRHFRKG